HAVLGRAVGGDVGVADLAGDARDVDHASPAALDHGADRGARAEEDAGEVGADRALPQLVVGLLERRGGRDPGVVDEDVDRAGRRARLLEGRRARVLVGDVERDRRRARAVRLDLAGDRFDLAARARGDGDGGAARGELERAGAADPATAAGDERDL